MLVQCRAVLYFFVIGEICGGTVIKREEGKFTKKIHICSLR